LRKRLAKKAEPKALERIGLTGQKYPGPLMAALSEIEETGLGELRDYMGKPPSTEGELFTSSVDSILKTLSEEGDEEYRKAYKTKMLGELEEGLDLLAARTSARDKYFGGGRIATSGEMIEDYLAELAVIQAEQDELAKERKLRAVQQALGLAEFEEAAPVRRVAVSQTLGALPRLVEQEGLDVEYQEWLRALNDMNIALDVATGLATYQPGYTTQTTGGEAGSAIGTALLAYSLFGGGGGGAGAIPGVDYMPPGQVMSPRGLPYIP